ncbi:MAG: hypothetical protein V1804_04850 [Patescibacteria group bacterium]
MASQVAHIIYAKKYFEKSDFLSEEKDEFILGCTFPDIRRIDGNIKRKDTHLRFYPLDLNLENLTPFEAGWKFHLYCDMRREEILNSYDFYSLKYTNEFWNHPAKMFEDELLYEKYDNWEKLANYFNDVPIISNGINVPQGTFELWYSILASYIKQKLNNNSISTFLSKQPGIAPIANDIIKIVDKLRKNDKVIEILGKVSEEII